MKKVLFILALFIGVASMSAQTIDKYVSVPEYKSVLSVDSVLKSSGDTVIIQLSAGAAPFIGIYAYAEDDHASADTIVATIIVAEGATNDADAFVDVDTLSFSGSAPYADSYINTTGSTAKYLRLILATTSTTQEGDWDAYIVTRKR